MYQPGPNLAYFSVYSPNTVLIWNCLQGELPYQTNLCRLNSSIPQFSNTSFIFYSPTLQVTFLLIPNTTTVYSSSLLITFHPSLANDQSTSNNLSSHIIHSTTYFQQSHHTFNRHFHSSPNHTFLN